MKRVSLRRQQIGTTLQAARGANRSVGRASLEVTVNICRGGLALLWCIPKPSEDIILRGLARDHGGFEMQADLNDLEAAQINTVALKAYARIAATWELDMEEAASLVAMDRFTWMRARKPGSAEQLTDDQLLRISVLIGIYRSLEIYFAEPLGRQWMTRLNAGSLFNGRRPVDTAIEGGLPQLLAVRTYLEALCEGA